MKQEELQEILRKHKLWVKGEDGGDRADLRDTCLYGADLRGADLRGANLTEADLSGANLDEADLRGANLTEADLSGADLTWADLRRTDLNGADLNGANLDFSCLPLSCGSLYARFDDRQLKQIAYHLVKAGLRSKNASKETKAELAKLIDFANGFHRVEECGKIEWDGES